MCAFQMKVVRDPFQTVKSWPQLSGLDICMFHLRIQYIRYHIMHILTCISVQILQKINSALSILLAPTCVCIVF